MWQHTATQQNQPHAGGAIAEHSNTATDTATGTNTNTPTPTPPTPTTHRVFRAAPLRIHPPQCPTQVAHEFRTEMARSPDDFICIHIKKLGTKHTWCRLRAVCKAAFRVQFQSTNDSSAASASSSQWHCHNQHGQARREEDPAVADKKREETSTRRLAICRLFASLIERSGKFQPYTKKAGRSNKTRTYINCACNPGAPDKQAGFQLERYDTKDYDALDAANYTDKV